MVNIARKRSDKLNFVLFFIIFFLVLTILFSLIKVPHFKKENHHINYSAMQKHIGEPFEVINTNEQSILANKIVYTIKINSELFSVVVKNGKLISYNKIDKTTE